MRFFTVFTILAASAMAFAGAIPDIIAKRDVTDVQNAMTTLSNQCDTILPKFDNCHDDDCTNGVALELKLAIDSCKNTLGGLTGGLGNPVLASIVANLITKIVVKLNDHKNQCGSGCPGIISIYAQIDASLSACLSVCFNLCIGLALLVKVLLGTLLTILQGLSLNLIIAICLL